MLQLIEQQAQKGNIDLLYGDEVQFSERGYVPYAWQFADEKVFIEASRGASINCFGLVSRSNHFRYKITDKSINADFIIDMLDENYL
jgi:hypothetical protein